MTTKQFYDMDEFLESYQPDSEMKFAKLKNTKERFKILVIKDVKYEDREELRAQLAEWR